VNASLERRISKIEQATAAPEFVFIPFGETPESVFKALGIAPERADRISYLRWLKPGEANEQPPE
jgi:hypothetical protein